MTLQVDYTLLENTMIETTDIHKVVSAQKFMLCNHRNILVPLVGLYHLGGIVGDPIPKGQL